MCAMGAEQWGNSPESGSQIIVLYSVSQAELIMLSKKKLFKEPTSIFLELTRGIERGSKFRAEAINQ